MSNSEGLKCDHSHGMEVNWKKPCDIMKKIRLKRKRTQTAKSTSSLKTLQTSETSNALHNKQKKSRENPFAKKRSSTENQQNGKKRILSIGNAFEYEEDIFSSNLSNVYEDSQNNQHEAEKGASEFSNSDLAFVYLNEDSIQGIFNEPKQEPEEDSGFRNLPTDWSIKTKARFLSNSSFAWCARLKASEEAASLHNVACPTEEKSSSKDQSDLRIDLAKSLCYWQHPSIPWFDLFPRFGAECKVNQHKIGEPITNDAIKSSLYDSWVAAFRSVFQLLRHGQCPFFYVCSQMYTALFRSHIYNQEQVNCILTPTSLGFRNSLKTEGIDFTMPLQDSSPISVPSNSPKHENEEMQHLDVDEEESWKSISGSLNLRHGKEVTTATQRDGLPRTAVLVRGNSNTQLLFNYMLNCKSSISASGPQAGLPPTILSPVHFMEASLKKLNYKAGIARTTSDVAPLKQNFSLDVSGPLLPNHIQSIVTLLRNSQSESEFSAAFAVGPYTVPFNANQSRDSRSPPHSHTWWRSDLDYVTIRQVTSEKEIFKCVS